MNRKEFEKSWMPVIILRDEARAELRSRNLQRWGFTTFILKFRKRHEHAIKYTVYIKR